MPSFSTLAGFTVLNLAILYQFFFKDILFTTLGVSRELQPLRSFPYTCRRINDHNLAACEDAWFEPTTRQLFLACSNVLGRKAWNPAMGYLAADRRSRTDHIIAMSLDHPHPDNPDSFAYRHLDLGDYLNSAGEKEISLLGMTGRTLPDGTIELYLINVAPHLDPNNPIFPADQTLTGPNSTIEAFSLPSSPDATTLTHLTTFHSPSHITTPNRPALHPDGSLYITNDHGPHRAGLQHTLSPILGTGNIVHCLPPSPSNRTYTPCTFVGNTHKFPNGLHYSTHSHLLFVPSSITGKITVYRPSPLPSTSTKLTAANLHESTLTKLTDIPLGMPLDNISEDPTTHDLLVAGFPKMAAMNELLGPRSPVDGRGAPTAVMRVKQIRRGAASGAEEQKGKGEGGAEGEGEWEFEAEKILEDPEGKVLPALTTVVGDGKGRLVGMGVVSGWIGVCERHA